MWKKLLKNFVPPVWVFKVRYLIGRLRYNGKQVYCPVCENWSRKFLHITGRGDVICPVCRSRERHRLLCMYWKQKTGLLEPPVKRLLHVAPEPGFYFLFRTNNSLNYTTIDLDSPWADYKADITNLPFKDESFDCIICNHVLEHVMDDRKAINELYRVLKSGGWATLQVPIKRNKTYEDAAVTSPEERLKIFGQHDHVRIYGNDYFDRLQNAGFKTEVISPMDIASQNDISVMALKEVESVIMARKN